jgi:hypothetical protein
VQRWTRRKKEALIAGDSNGLHELAVCQNESRCDLRDSALLVDGSIVENHDRLNCSTGDKCIIADLGGK